MQLNMLEAMNIYVNVVEQGSFIRAAEVLELHRPAYSSPPLSCDYRLTTGQAAVLISKAEMIV